MNEQIIVKHNGKRVAPLTVIDLPPPITFGDCESNPQLIIDILQGVDGDVEAFITQFNTRAHAPKITVLVKALSILNAPGNEKLRDEWDSLLAAFEQAKYMIAKTKAVKFISDFEPPKGERKKHTRIGDVVAYGRMWLAQDFEEQKTRGRKKGNASSVEPKGTEGGEGATALLDALKEGVKNNE